MIFILLLLLLLLFPFLRFNKETFKLWNSGRSKIHGNGAIATKEIKKGTIIDIAWKKSPNGLKITTFGKLINHSNSPTTVLSKKKENGIDIYSLKAKKNILKNEEITCNYNTTPSYIAKAHPDWK